MSIKRKWIALFVIIIIYGVAYQGYEGFYYFNGASTKFKHIINYALLILVAVTGYWGWLKIEWIKNIWVLLYGAALLVITVAGIIDIYAYIENESLRDFLHVFRFIFLSPVPFAILLFLSGNKFFYKKNTHSLNV